jgi:UDPglucose 6-dehydrogenase
MNLKDVVIGVIGNGVLGQAMVRGMVEYVKEVKINDIVRERSTHELADMLDCDFLFLCLPTPADADGFCDTRAVQEALAAILEEWQEKFGQVVRQHEYDGLDDFPIIVIRSTVDVGFTGRMADAMVERGFPPTILHNPEFLTARCNLTDFNTPSRHLIGSVCRYRHSRAASVDLMEMYHARFPGIPCYNILSSDETELCKLACNGFFATKVVYFNVIRMICEKLDLNWDNVVSGMVTDGRIAHSHTQVPGHDGKYGFGGMCFPKDVANLRTTFTNQMDEIIGGELIRAVEAVNKQLRDYKSESC